MDTKHTPGPWEIIEVTSDTASGPTPYPRYIAGSVTVAELPERSPLCMMDERAANALLIAAAPDLLEALKVAERALNAMGDHINGMNAEEGISDEVNPAFESVRTAIAKATTRTP